jgi:thioredoxin 1
MYEIRQENYSELDHSKGLVIVEYGAPWCDPCKSMKGIIEELENEMSDKCNFYYVDVEKHDRLTQAENVCSVPTLIVYKNGAEVDRMFGTFNLPALKARMKEV